MRLLSAARSPKVFWQTSLKPIPPDPRIARARRRSIASTIAKASLEMARASVTQGTEIANVSDPLRILPAAQSQAPLAGCLDGATAHVFSPAEDAMADGSIRTWPVRACPAGWSPDPEWDLHDGVDLALWREYVAAANAGAFDFCAAEALERQRRAREDAEEREMRAEGGAQ